MGMIPTNAVGLGAEGQPNWITSIFNPVWETTSSILKAQWGQPAPGTVITTPQGQYIRQANGMPVPVATIGANVGVGTGGGGGITMVTLGVVVVALLAIGQMRRN